MFLRFFKFFGKSSRKSSEVFGKHRKFSENFGNHRKCSEIFEIFGNGSKVIFRYFYDFLKFSKNLQKSSDVFGNLRKQFSDVIGNVCNGSQELKDFGDRF